MDGVESLTKLLQEQKNFVEENIKFTKQAVQELRLEMTDLMQRKFTGVVRGVAAPGGKGAPFIAQKMVEQLTTHQGFKSLLNSGGTIQIELGSDLYPEFKAAITGDSGDRPLVSPDRSTTILFPAQRRLMIESLLPSVPTDSNMTEFPQESVLVNNAEPQGSAASPTGTEGELFAESDMSFTLEQSPIVTIGHMFTVSRQALDDAPGLQQHIENRGIYGLQLEVEDELLNGTGASGKLDGLINNATAFNRGATGDTRADVLRKAVTQLLLSDHIPTGCVIHPHDDEQIDLAKDSQSRYLMVKVNGRIWQIPAVVTQSIAQGKFLVADFQMVGRIRDREQVFVEISTQHADYFRRHLAAVKIGRRLGLEIHRGLAMVYGDFNVGE